MTERTPYETVLRNLDALTLEQLIDLQGIVKEAIADLSPAKPVTVPVDSRVIPVVVEYPVTEPVDSRVFQVTQLINGVPASCGSSPFAARPPAQYFGRDNEIGTQEMKKRLLRAMGVYAEKEDLDGQGGDNTSETVKRVFDYEGKTIEIVGEVVKTEKGTEVQYPAFVEVEEDVFTTLANILRNGTELSAKK